VKKYYKYSFFLILILAIAATSCKKKKENKPPADLSRTYFSIRGYALDEWNTFAHSPFTIVKTVKVNDGKTDSSYTNSDVMNWAPIFKTFFETDISDPKFLEKYKYSYFPDNQDGTENLFWEATDPDDDELFTKKLLITVDQYTRRVKGVYIETSKKNFLGEHIQKLYYKPMKTIQIQTDDKPILGSSTFTIVQYDFML